MEQFREESRVEEQRRAEAVATREEAEQRAAALQAAAESEAAAKSADAQMARADAHHACAMYGSCFGTLCCRWHSGVHVVMHVDSWLTCSHHNVQPAAQELEQTSEVESAPGVKSSGRGGAESDGEGADLQVRITWQTPPARLGACPFYTCSSLRLVARQCPCLRKAALTQAHAGCASLC